MSTAQAQTTSKRSSLREFQQRLATRLSQSQNTQIATHLAVEVGAKRLLLPLSEAGEITSDVNIQPLPHAKPWFLGVTVLRGQIVTVTDLAVLLGERAQATSTGTFVAISEALEINCLLRVDRLAGLRTLDQYTADVNQARGDMGARFFDDKKQVWEELSLAALARDEQFLQVFR
jgi:twitching motility protein PilI